MFGKAFQILIRKQNHKVVISFIVEASFQWSALEVLHKSWSCYEEARDKKNDYVGWLSKAVYDAPWIPAGLIKLEFKVANDNSLTYLNL
jgi:hypothetical protein